MNGAGHTVLVIGENETDLEKIRGSLSTPLCRVLTRQGRQGSVSAVLRAKPDLVLLDISIATSASGGGGGGGGPPEAAAGRTLGTLSIDAVAKILSRADARPDTIILLHGNLPAQTLRLKALACGADGYIQRSDDASYLAREVHAWLNGQRTRTSGTVRAGTNYAVTFDPSMTLSAPKATGLRCRVLFVDDDPASHSFYRRSVVVEEMAADYVVSLHQALRIAQSELPPDVIVSDVLRGERGIELYRTLRAFDATWRFRFIFLTGGTNQTLQRLDVPVLKKPIAPEGLRDAIRYAVTSLRFLGSHARTKSS